MDSLTLKERAANILQMANSLAEELAQTGNAEPSFEHGPPPALQSDAPESNASILRNQLFEMVDELHTLLRDPVHHLTPELRNPSLSVHPIIRLGIAENFPEEGTTVEALAKNLGLRESIVGRLLRHSATHRVYYEAKPDFFIHTASSRALARNEGLRAWVLVGCEELLPASHKIPDALLKYPGSEEPQHSGWNLQNGTDKTIFRALPDMPDRAAVFARAMTWVTQPGLSPQYLAAAFPWKSNSESDDEGYTVVDVGGGLGHISMELATHRPRVQFIVQDAADVIAQAQDTPLDEGMRLVFQALDFFQDQPVHGADVYLLRLVLHDWSDKYAIKILRALIPALKPGARVVINDRVIPGYHQVHYLTERQARDNDMYMMAFQNARERTAEDWKTLVKEADHRFEWTALHQTPKSIFGVVVVTWKG